MILKQVIRYTNADALEATWVEEIDGQEIVVKCHAYSNGQMDMLRADLGADAAQYEEMIAEVAATYTPPPPVAAPVPTTCTRRQGRLALLQAGYFAAVEQSIAAIADPVQRMAAQIEYEADTWERDNAFLQGMWAQLGGTPEQLDDLFALAVTL